MFWPERQQNITYTPAKTSIDEPAPKERERERERERKGVARERHKRREIRIGIV